MAKSYRFWYHYNKPKSRKYKRPIMTVHYKGKCIHTDSIACDVPTETHRRMRQPYMVVRGWAKSINVLDGGLAADHTVDDDIALWGKCPVWPYERLEIK